MIESDPVRTVELCGGPRDGETIWMLCPRVGDLVEFPTKFGNIPLGNRWSDYKYVFAGGNKAILSQWEHAP